MDYYHEKFRNREKKKHGDAICSLMFFVAAFWKKGAKTVFSGENRFFENKLFYVWFESLNKNKEKCQKNIRKSAKRVKKLKYNKNRKKSLKWMEKTQRILQNGEMLKNSCPGRIFEI